MTTAVFLSGPLAWRPLLTSITDEDVEPCALASLADHAVIAAPQDVFPALCGQPGAHAQGILLSAPSEDTRNRLAFFAQGLPHKFAVFEYHLLGAAGGLQGSLGRGQLALQ